VSSHSACVEVDKVNERSTIPLLRLRVLARTWCGADERTAAYADLVVAFRLAGLKEPDLARELVRGAAAVLSRQQAEPSSWAWAAQSQATAPGPDPVHACLLNNYQYRINQALAGSPAHDPLPDDYLQELDHVQRYAVNRVRLASPTLEPHEEAAPHAVFSARWLDNASGPLAAAAIPEQHRDRFEECLQAAQARDRWEPLPPVLADGLNVALRGGEVFARGMLARLPLVLPTWPEPVDDPGWLNCARVAERGLSLAALLQRPEVAPYLAGHLRVLLRARSPLWGSALRPPLVESCLVSLRRLGLRDEVAQLVHVATEITCRGRGWRRRGRGALRGTRRLNWSHWREPGSDSGARARHPSSSTG
jgi:hypothetical protein